MNLLDRVITQKWSCWSLENVRLSIKLWCSKQPYTYCSTGRVRLCKGTDAGAGPGLESSFERPVGLSSRCCQLVICFSRCSPFVYLDPQQLLWGSANTDLPKAARFRHLRVKLRFLSIPARQQTQMSNCSHSHNCFELHNPPTSE